MNFLYLIIEKEDHHVMPYKPKPLCSCFVGDKMVDMYPRFGFDAKIVGWGRAYRGHCHFNDFFNDIEVCDNEEMNEVNDAISEYFRFHQLYLH